MSARDAKRLGSRVSSGPEESIGYGAEIARAAESFCAARRPEPSRCACGELASSVRFADDAAPKVPLCL